MKRIYMVILTIICSIGIAVSISYAWFYSGFNVDPLATGTSAEAYYHSGKGTEGDPYIITTPRHLYNLAWLQYLGTYNKDSKNKFSTTYFKIGTGSNPITLDMTGWNLPPIGTTKYPFIGNFNGNGSTISNLTTTNSFSDLPKHPSGVTSENFDQSSCSVIGFFGSIGSFDNSVIADNKTEGTYSYDEANNQVHDFYLSNTSVHTACSTTLIGTVAGYVNGKIEDVGIIQNNLNIEASNAKANSISSANNNTNVSEFAVVGYAESDFTTQKTKSSTIIYNPTYNYSHFNFNGMGNRTDWGGSINMSSLYDRIKTKIPYTVQNYEYVNNEIVYNNIYSDQGTPKESVTTKTNTSNQRVSWSGDENGGYIKRVGTSGQNQFNYLTAVYKNVIVVTKTDSTNGFMLYSNDHYLNITSSRASNSSLDFNVSLLTDIDTGASWKEESNAPGVNLCTYNEDDGKKYYLIVNSDFTIGISSSSTTSYQWYYDEDNNSYYIEYNSNPYYLKYFNGDWTFSPVYVIGDGHGNYISYDNGISNESSIENASPFMFKNDGTIITKNGDYLRNNSGQLQINSNNSTLWNASYISVYSTYNNKNYYIQYDENDGWKLVTPSLYYIQYNGNYLYLDSGNIQTSGTSSIDLATKFAINNNTIYANDNGTTYYLQYDGSNFSTSENTNAYTSWSIDDNGFYRTIGNNKYYLMYDNGWKVSLVPTIGYYISYEGNYLTADGTSGTKNSTTPSTKWYVDSNNYVYTKINNNNYYLYANESTWAISISTSTSQTYMYQKSGQTILYYYGGKTAYYCRYNGSTWKEGTSEQALTWETENISFGSALSTGIEDILLEETKTISKPYRDFLVYSRSDSKKQASVFNYIPLNTEDDYTTLSSNTGYIMAGGYEYTKNQEYYADIRVSEYGISNISSSFTSNNWVNNGILTVGDSGYGTGKNIGSGSYPESNYKKYASSKSQLLNTLKGKSYVYGLHFMNSNISINHLVVAPKVLINGEYYENYEMPEDAIDFTLASKGFINFFAGTYFSGNNSFFSLHQIIRDDNHKITAIKHISKIYSANSNYGDGWQSADNIYQFADGTWSGANVSNNSKYSKTFDKTWIENPETLGSSGQLTGTYKTYLWYFEIPVNKGEFALGSVDGGTGAYLIYLDIGANAAPVDRTEITQQTKYVSQTLVYVNGIQILSTANYTADSNSAVAIIPQATTGTISISKDSNGISISKGNSGFNSTYYDPDIGFNGTLSPIASSERVSNVLKYVDYNRATDKLYYTTIYNDGTSNTSYDCYNVDSNGNKTAITETGDAAEWGLLKIVSGAGVEGSLSEFTFTTSTTTKLLDYYSFILTDDITDLTDVNEMRVVEDSSVVPAATQEYTYEHSYHISGNDITMTPNGLVVYIGPDTKSGASVAISGNVATVSVTVGNITYTFTFNASTINSTNKTVTIRVS